MNTVRYFLENYTGSRISSDYGMRWHPLGNVWRMHNGVDFVFSPRNALLTSPVNGIVRAAKYYRSRGNTVSIKVKDANELVLMQHLAHNSMLVKPGEVVKVGDAIANCGSTGYSTGAHLHLEIKVDDGAELGGRVWGSPHDYIGGESKPSTKFIVDDLVTTTAVPHQNLREHPSIRSNIVGQMVPGSLYLVVGNESVWADGYHWWNVGEGWVAERWLKYIGRDDEEPVVVTPPEKVKPPEEIKKPVKKPAPVRSSTAPGKALRLKERAANKARIRKGRI